MVYLTVKDKGTFLTEVHHEKSIKLKEDTEDT